MQRLVQSFTPLRRALTSLLVLMTYLTSRHVLTRRFSTPPHSHLPRNRSLSTSLNFKIIPSSRRSILLSLYCTKPACRLHFTALASVYIRLCRFLAVFQLRIVLSVVLTYKEQLSFSDTSLHDPNFLIRNLFSESELKYVITDDQSFNPS
jgi:hypothetical protein